MDVEALLFLQILYLLQFTVIQMDMENQLGKHFIFDQFGADVSLKQANILQQILICIFDTFQL